MDQTLKYRTRSRISRTFRVRNALQRGTAEKPRLSVSKTNSHLYVQLIDDMRGITLAGIGTCSKENRGGPYGKKSKEAARYLGGKIAELAKGHQVEKVVFDRGRNKYHGTIAELAQAAREAGLRF